MARARMLDAIPRGVASAGFVVLTVGLGSCGEGAEPKAGTSTEGLGSDAASDATGQMAAATPEAVTYDFPGGAVPEGVVPGRPNVLIITIDTLRADHLATYGYPRTTSPFLDELAGGAVVFERAYAPIATTLPSHTTMFTGVYPHEHGVLANIADGRTYQRREDLVTLAQLFERAGYATQAVVAAAPLHPRFGLDAGFDGYRTPDKKQRPANANTLDALAALEELSSSDKPGFLWVHYFDPHGPYNPPRKFEIKYRMDDEMRAYLAERQFADRAQRPTGQWNELEKGVDRYDGEIAYTDHQIKRLFTAAKESDWLDGAVIAVLADHGEGLNQHGIPGHGQTWEEQLHVPLMLSIPGVAPRRLSWPVSLADFSPTLLHVFDLPGKDEFLKQVSGINRFRTDVVHGESWVLGQSSPRQSDTEGIGYALRFQQWKLVVDETGAASLYELNDDPFELADVASDHPRVVERMRAELESILERQKHEVRTQDASDEVEAEMRALGYGGNRPK